jgi:Predicted S-adenosylmethionine-dependent methyltransferase
LFIATDWQDYAEHILRVFAKDDNFFNLAGPDQTAPRPHWRPHTRFEGKGRRQDHKILDLAYACRK